MEVAPFHRCAFRTPSDHQCRIEIDDLPIGNRLTATREVRLAANAPSGELAVSHAHVSGILDAQRFASLAAATIEMDALDQHAGCILDIDEASLAIAPQDNARLRRVAYPATLRPLV